MDRMLMKHPVLSQMKGRALLVSYHDTRGWMVALAPEDPTLPDSEVAFIPFPTPRFLFRCSRCNQIHTISPRDIPDPEEDQSEYAPWFAFRPDSIQVVADIGQEDVTLIGMCEEDSRDPL